MAKKNVVIGENDGDIADFIQGKKFSTYVKSLIRLDIKSKQEGKQSVADISECTEMVREILDIVKSGKLSIENKANNQGEKKLDRKTKSAIKGVMSKLGKASKAE